MTQRLTQAICSMVCLARHTEDAATSEGRYLRKGSECTRASSHKYCRQRVKTQQITKQVFVVAGCGRGDNSPPEVTACHYGSTSIYLCEV